MTIKQPDFEPQPGGYDLSTKYVGGYLDVLGFHDGKWTARATIFDRVHETEGFSSREEAAQYILEYAYRLASMFYQHLSEYIISD